MLEYAYSSAYASKNYIKSKYIFPFKAGYSRIIYKKRIGEIDGM